MIKYALIMQCKEQTNDGSRMRNHHNKTAYRRCSVSSNEQCHLVAVVKNCHHPQNDVLWLAYRLLIMKTKQNKTENFKDRKNKSEASEIL